MFSDQKRSSTNKNKRKGASANTSGLAVTILTSGCHFEGKLYCKGASRIGGQIEGKIVSEGLLIIEEEARVKADIIVDEVIVLGQIDGKLRANKRVELCKNSSFQGEIVTPALVIKEGAQFNGHATMTNNTETELPTAMPHDMPSPTQHEPQLSAADPQPHNDRIPDVSIVNS